MEYTSLTPLPQPPLIAPRAWATTAETPTDLEPQSEHIIGRPGADQVPCCRAAVMAVRVRCSSRSVWVAPTYQRPSGSR